MAIDAKTRLLLYKMVNGGVLESINGIVATGKESVVFHAVGGTLEERDVQLPAECAVKVFKTTLNEFRNRDPYIRDDYRFQERYSKLNPRKIVKLWAEKEMLNLKRYWPIDWLIGHRSTYDWFHRLIDWLIDWFMLWSFDWLIDWIAFLFQDDFLWCSLSRATFAAQTHPSSEFLGERSTGQSEIEGRRAQSTTAEAGVRGNYWGKKCSQWLYVSSFFLLA